MTSNMIYIVALGVGFKCLRKIHLNVRSQKFLRPCNAHVEYYQSRTYLFKVVDKKKS